VARGITVDYPYASKIVYVERNAGIVCQSEEGPAVTSSGTNLESCDCGLKWLTTQDSTS
jgi:hypothetical protein